MRNWLIQARRHAAAIHDIVQLAAGATAFAVVLVFITLSGRSQDDPVVRWTAEVGAAMAASVIVPSLTPVKTDRDAAASSSSSPTTYQSAKPPEALAFQVHTESMARGADLNQTILIAY